MNAELVEWLACPTDSSHALRFAGAASRNGRIESGEIHCGACGARYPVSDGIVSFLGADSVGLSDLQRHEKDAREREYGRGEMYETEISRLPELDAVARALGDCRGLNVLDAGCGAGHVTRVVAARGAARIVALDFSWSGLIGHRLRDSPSVDLIHADVSKLPLRDAVFDAAVTTGVIQHFPSQAQRAAFVGHVARALKAGGKLVLSTFNWNAYDRRRAVAKEGFFDNGIYRRKFEPAELRTELDRHFEIESILPVQIFLPNTYRVVQALGRRNVVWDRFWQRRRIALDYGNLLLALCRRRG